MAKRIPLPPDASVDRTASARLNLEKTRILQGRDRTNFTVKDIHDIMHAEKVHARQKGDIDWSPGWTRTASTSTKR